MEDCPISLETSQTSLLKRGGSYSAERASSTSRVHLLRGRSAVAAMSQMLDQLSRRTAQAGAMHWLQYSLDTPTAMQKIPILLLVGLDPGVRPANVTADDVLGAVLLYEYRVAGRGIRVFATDDTTGQRTVIAPPHIRSHVAEAAAQALVDVGALAVMITFEGNGQDRSAPSPQRLTAACELAKRTRSVPRHLLLAESHKATLASLGRHTRRNLRYYRRRLESDMGAFFVPAVEMDRKEFLAINRASTNPVSDSLAAWRYDSTHRTPGTLFAGVRAQNGLWLSLIGGRRHMRVTEIDWQMNLAGLPRYSLSTVMRSYILQHEVELSTEKLAFTGGTPHSMRHSFDCVDAVDVVALRRSPVGWILRRMSRWIFPEHNFLGHALRDQHLRWSRYAADATSIFTAPTTVSDVHDLLELENAAGDVDRLAGDILRA